MAAAEWLTGVLMLEVDLQPTKLQQSADGFVTLAAAADSHAFSDPITFAIDGYDDDPRPLWEIPEVMAYLRCWRRMVIRRGGGPGLRHLDATSTALLLLAHNQARVKKVGDQYEIITNVTG
jgi:hypothetical protein